jgi:aminotransferase
MHRRYGLEYDPVSEILVTVGGSEALDLAARTLINPGDEVIIVEPCFVSYKATVLMAHGVPVIVATRQEDDFKLRPDDLEKAITPKTKYLMLGYPCNPTGATMTQSDLEPIIKVLEKYPDVIVLSDELYSELTYGDDPFVSIASFPSMRDRTIVVNGFSKSFAMTGWRIGYATGPGPIIQAMNKVHQYCIMSSPTTAQFAVIEAALHGDKDVQLMRDEYNRRRRVIHSGLLNAGLTCFEPTGAFYAFPSIRELGISSEEFCERFLMEKKVAIVPGNAFGASGEGHVRISYASSMENIKEAIVRLGAFVNDIRSASSPV